ncbi:MAG: glucuronate isomerase [Rhodobacter sp.]|uniref:glucuronate isomerase n=1 Tax=Phenylobacterium sp. TaxID=1871053 RepID=UPI0025D296F8|nr:glucuronate isomerase [Phenylobacterium sp.]MCA3521553.1 glucuronate isomerase [Rhodobacter sp.]MCA3549149.1 glucuronate isomerase [Rhodobacter sp.]MCA3551145.1 glucuronate isomerase [Rhodobacter sp.]MCA6280338.1 glucuronate isomerase [Phenylobacterium sp.]MCA6317255.1 glucuronate isomerase [Phenylobacterium sp.]
MTLTRPGWLLIRALILVVGVQQVYLLWQFISRCCPGPSRPVTLHPGRLFPADPASRAIARDLFAAIGHLPIVSPHGHTDPRWWGENPAFENPAALFVMPDHCVCRMLVSQGVPFAAPGIGPGAGTDPRTIWRTFAGHYHLFRATPSRLWVDHALETVFSMTTRLCADTADAAHDAIAGQPGHPACRPRALHDRFGIEVIATTDPAIDDLRWHKAARDSGWTGRVVPTCRPDAVTDPDFEGFRANVETLATPTGCDTGTWEGYLAAHRARRIFFRTMGATATDHGHPTPLTDDLPGAGAAALCQSVLSGRATPGQRETFRAQMLTEFARMSVEDGLVMQLHPGSFRNHSARVIATLGRDRGSDIPQPVSFTAALKPLLDAVGMDPRLTMILFTLDETTCSRELAPLAGACPSLRLGPPWWFHDSFEGIRRFRQMATETAGFLNTAGFNDDTRALCSIPARHDLSRRADCAFLADLVTTHRLDEDEAHHLAPLLANGLARAACKL